MHPIQNTDLRDALQDIQQIDHAIAEGLKALSAQAPEPLKHHLFTLAAAAELACDKAHTADGLIPETH